MKSISYVAAPLPALATCLGAVVLLVLLILCSAIVLFDRDRRRWRL